MNILFYGICLILTALLIHFIIWRIRLPQNQTKALLKIFFGTLMIGTLVLWKFPDYVVFFGIATPAEIYEYIQLSFFFVSLTLAYIVTYSAIEVDSPSLVIVMDIAQAGRAGLDKKSLKQKLNDDLLVVPRVRDLITGRLAYLDGKTYKLTGKGIFIARIFIAYRRLLRKTQKGG